VFAEGSAVLAALARCGLPPAPPEAAPLGRLSLAVDGRGAVVLSIVPAAAPEPAEGADPGLTPAAEDVDLGSGPWPFQVRRLCQQAGLAAATPVLAAAVPALWAAFAGLQCLALTVAVAAGAQKEPLAVTASVELDLNLRQSNPAVAELLNSLESSPTLRLKRLGVDYIPMSGGRVGLISVGAGETMAAIDLIAQHGEQAAAFCDISGGVTATAVAAALAEVCAAGVGSILINVFGGVTRVDRVAEHLLAVLAQAPPGVPVVVRLEGTGAEAGRALVQAAGHDTPATLRAAVAQAVALAGGKAP